jgi:lipoprotein-anchoring transpeptidase ErfK/SrfK
MLTRRHFIITSATLFSGAIGLPAGAQDRVDFDTTVERPDPDPFANNPWGLHPRFMPTRVQHRAGLTPGDIHVDAMAKYLYHIGNDGTAMRYGVAIGRADLYESGVFRIGRKQEWPSWRPTDQMIEREPNVYAQFADGMPGGPENPLGARALYLYEGQSRHASAHPRDAAALVDRDLGLLGLRADGQRPYHGHVRAAWNSARRRISIRLSDA